jgi:hypothetical protein
MVMPWWNYYCNYLASLASQGSLPLGAVYFDSAAIRDIDIIASTQDPRIPGIQKLAAAVQSG